MKILLLIFLTLTFTFAAFAQTGSDAARRVQLIEALETSQAEVIASRKFISALKEQVESKQAQITALNDKDELAQKAITGLQSEISNLRLAIVEAEKVFEIRKQEVAELKKDLEKTRRKLHRARAFAKYLTVAAGVLAAIVVIK